MCLASRLTPLRLQADVLIYLDTSPLEKLQKEIICCTVYDCAECFRQRMAEDPFCVASDQWCGCHLTDCDGFADVEARG